MFPFVIWTWHLSHSHNNWWPFEIVYSEWQQKWSFLCYCEFLSTPSKLENMPDHVSTLSIRLPIIIVILNVFQFTVRPCTHSMYTLHVHKVVSERFQNNQNENDMNYKNSHRMKFLVFALRRSLAGFHYIISTSRELFAIIRTEKAPKRLRVHVTCKLLLVICLKQKIYVFFQIQRKKTTLEKN